MIFDMVVGNPPYNNDIYIKFILQLKDSYLKHMLMITPAKWQAKGGELNEKFRQEIVPYMSKIVYYPDCTDVFAIGDPGGISYYLINTDEVKQKTIINVSHKQRLYNDKSERDFKELSLYNKGYELVTKIFKNNVVKPIKIEAISKDGRYQVYCANKVSLVSNIPKTCLWSMDGVFNCLGLCQIIDIKDGNRKSKGVPDDSKLIYASNNIEECKSFVSWAYCRFTRYMISLSLCGLTGIATSNEWWRFVPAPEAFDHIYTDQELYKKYNLSQEEINIIESVIKERK